MTRIEELNELPEHLNREVVDYAEYLLEKYHIDKQSGNKKIGPMSVGEEKFQAKKQVKQ